MVTSKILKVVIAHCYQEDSSSHWYAGLAESIRMRNPSISVTVLDMSEPQKPQLAKWLEHLGRYVNEPETTALIGHSIGGNLALHYAASLAAEGKTLAGLALVASARKYNHPALSGFDCSGLNFPSIRSAIGNVLLVASSNDPHIPFEESMALHYLLETPMMLCRDGHMGRTSAGGHTLRLAPVALGAIMEFVGGAKPETNHCLALGDAIAVNGSMTYNSPLGL